MLVEHIFDLDSAKRMHKYAMAIAKNSGHLKVNSRHSTMMPYSKI